MTPLRWVADRPRATPPHWRGFTLVELLVVIAVIAILAAFMLPAFSRAKEQADEITCLDNHKQLTLAWMLYANDNQDRFTIGFVPGFLTWGVQSDNTNTQYFTSADYNPLVHYGGGVAKFYKSPSDRYLSVPQIARGFRERVRSYALNCCLGVSDPSRYDWYGENPGGISIYNKFSDFHQKGPSQIFVTIDVHTDSINDGSVVIRTTEPPWFDAPACYHRDNGCCFSFADGHSEIHHWRDVFIQPVRYAVENFTASATSTDYQWYLQRWTEQPQ